MEPTRKSGQRHGTFAIVTAGAGLLALAVLHTSVIYFDIPAGYVGLGDRAILKSDLPARISVSQKSPSDERRQGLSRFRIRTAGTGEFMIYANADGSRQKIPLSAGAPNTPIGVDPSSNIYVFFVGTEGVLARSWSLEPKTH